ncbi:putative ribonuclease H-like domain-containing protein [Tanacetum coccineum]
MLAIPDEHLLKFHACKDAKSLWEAIKNTFGGNKESKKMQKTILKQNYENFVASSQEGLEKTYDRFQKLISQLEIHGEVISQEDANLKLLRSLPSTWNIIALIMRNKSDLDTLSMYDLYNNLKVYESEIKGQTSSSSNSQNVAFVSFDNSSNTNETVNTAHSVSAASSKDQASTASYDDDVMFSFFSYQSNAPQLDNEDLEQIDADNLEEIDFKWQVAMLTMRVKRAPRNQGNKNRDNPRRNAPVDTSTTNALVVQDRISGYNWSSKAEEGITNFALMACTSLKTLNMLEEALKEKNDLKLKLEKFEESSKNLTKLINSQISVKDKTGLGYDSQMNESELNKKHMNDSEEFHIPPPYTGNYMPPKPDLSFYRLDESVFKSAVRKTTTSVPETETSISKTSKDIVEKPKTVRPSAPIIKEWDTNSDNDMPINAAKQSSPRAAASISTGRPVNIAAPKPKVNDALPITYYYFKAHSPGNPQYTLQDQGIFDSGCSRHMTRNKSFLADYQEIDGGFVAFEGSPKGGKNYWKRLDVLFYLLTLSYLMKAEAVSTACYVQNRVLVTKPHNKTPYELLHGRPPSISFMRLFGCLVTIHNTLDPLGKKFDGKADKGFLVGYSINSKAFRVFNTRTRKVEENLHINFLENKPNIAGSGPDWLFDIDLLTNSMNYEPVTAGNQTNKNASIKDNVDTVPTQQYILLPLLYDSPQSSEDAVADDVGKKTNQETVNEGKRNGQEKEGGASNKEDYQNVQDFRAALDNLLVQQKEGYANNTNRDSIVSVAGQSFTNVDDLLTDPLMPNLEDTSIFSGAYDDEDVGAEANLNNLETTMNVSPIPITKIHKDHPKDQIIGDINSATQTRRMTKISKEHMDVKSAFLYGTIEEEVYVCQPLGFEDPQFPDKVYKVEKALYGLHQAHRAWYETLYTYLLENKFRRGIIDKTLFIKKDKGDILLVQVHVDDIIFGSTKKSLCIEFESLMHKKFQMSSMGELTFFLGLQDMQKDDGIFISQDKYVADILKKFNFVTVKTASTPIETNKSLLKDEEAEDVDVHLYRSMIRSLMYLIASRPDIMFAICAWARFQFTPKVSHLHAVKRIFRYLKGQPKLGLWYPRDSPFDLEAFSDSDYAGASLDRKSTTGGCQFLGKRLISWQCKKQTVVANSTTEAEYVATANCCGQVLWIQNQMLDYGFNFMNTKIHIDNESTICIVKNLVFHAKTKHIEIRHHFIRDSYKKRLIQVIKIHTDHNVVDLLTKAFDVSRFNFMIASIGLLNLYRTKRNADFHQIVNFLNASTIRKGKGFSGTVTPLFQSMLVPQVVEGEGSGQPSDPQPPSLIAPPSQEEQDTEIPQSGGLPEKVGDEAVHKELGDKVERAATTAASLDAEQDSGKILKTQSTVIPNVSLSQGIGISGSPMCQEAMVGTIAQTRSEMVPTPSYDSPLLGGKTPGSDEERLEHQDDLTDFVPPTPHDSPLSGGHTLGSDEGRPNINKLMVICTNLSNRVLALETSKAAQDLVINKLKKKVKRLEKKQRARTPGMKLFKIDTSRRKSLDKENVSKQGRNLKTGLMFEEGDFNDDIDDMVNEAMENVEEDTVNAASTVNTATTGVSAASASVTTVGVSISTAESGTPPTTTTTAFEDEDLNLIRHNQKKSVLNNKGRVIGQMEIRPVWNNAQRVNHQNKLTYPHPKRNFVLTTVATKSGQVPVNAAKQSSPRATTSISTARPVNIAAPKPKVNDALPITYSYFKAHSLVRRAFNQKSAAKTNKFNEKVNISRVNNVTTARPKAVFSVAMRNGENADKSSACWIWRPTGNVID